jgi:hypothetical protein
MPNNKHHGTSIDGFLKEEGVLQRLQDSMLAAVHDTATGLHKAGTMDRAMLCELDRLEAIPNKHIREASGDSQTARKIAGSV